MVRPRGCLALSDNAVGGCLQGGATKPGPGAGAPVGVSRTPAWMSGGEGEQRCLL